MEKSSEYRIPFVGLKQGVHQFTYEVEDDFFSRFENTELKESKAKVDLSLDKKDNFFVLDFYIGGTVKVECDRCSQPFDQELLDEYRVFVKFDDEAKMRGEQHEDVIFISPTDTHLDVSQLIYEFVNLSIPVQKICPLKKDGTPGCNEKVLAILREGQNNDKNEADPRWSALKKLK